MIDFTSEEEARIALAHIESLTRNSSYEWFMFLLYEDMQREAESLIKETDSDIRVRILQGKVLKGRDVNEKLDEVRDSAIEYLRAFQ